MLNSLFDLLPGEEELKKSFIKEDSNEWKWWFKDYPKNNGLNVFSLFACGGGSTMGYKLAGCNVLGCVEIDYRMNQIYLKNHNPKFNFLMDVRDFNKLDNLPKELYNLDILDGSPPCSTFSLAGKREKHWGKELFFKEGQKLQTLDDLPFVMIDTVKKLKPKVVIMENVEGLLYGKAFNYVRNIFKRFNDIGYSVRLKLLKCEDMGIPQKRHRVFFIATRLNFDLEKINLNFNCLPIKYKDIRMGIGRAIDINSLTYDLVYKAIFKDRSLKDTKSRYGLKPSCFQNIYVRSNDILPTICCNSSFIDIECKTYVSNETIISAQTFPQDFDFLGNNATKITNVCGMSVPPVMLKKLTTRIIESGIFDN